MREPACGERWENDLTGVLLRVHNDNSLNGLSPLGLLEVLTLNPTWCSLALFPPATGNGDQEQGHHMSSLYSYNCFSSFSIARQPLRTRVIN